MSGSGDTVRIRRYPLNPTFAKPVGVIPAATEHLFGNSLADLVYELAILWVPDPRTKSLKVAYLAAVADIDEKPKIYARAELPPPAILNEETLKGIRLHKVEILDDFEDAFAREETGGDSLA
jgi:hypothetical protein